MATMLKKTTMSGPKKTAPRTKKPPITVPRSSLVVLDLRFDGTSLFAEFEEGRWHIPFGEVRPSEAARDAANRILKRLLGLFFEDERIEIVQKTEIGGRTI